MLSARFAAVILLLLLVSAIYYFGVLDANGHFVIIVVLVILALSHNPLAAQFNTRSLATTAATHTGFYMATLFLFIGIYCGGHCMSYRPNLNCGS